MEATQAELGAYSKSTEVPSALLLGLKWSAVDYTAPWSQYGGLHITLFLLLKSFSLFYGSSGAGSAKKVKTHTLKKNKSGYLALCLQDQSKDQSKSHFENEQKENKSGPRPTASSLTWKLSVPLCDITKGLVDWPASGENQWNASSFRGSLKRKESGGSTACGPIKPGSCCSVRPLLGESKKCHGRIVLIFIQKLLSPDKYKSENSG